MAMGCALLRRFPFSCTGEASVPVYGTWARSGYRDHLARVADAGAEAEQQHGGARRDLAAFQHPGQGQRNGRRRGVARGHDVVGHQRLRRAEPAGDRLDDPQVGLVRYERGQVGRVHPGPLAGLLRDRAQRGGGPPEHRLALLDDEAVPVRDVDLVCHVAGAAPHDGPDPGLGRIGHRADHHGARAVGEDDAGGAVGPVDPLGQLLGPDEQDVARRTGPYRVAGAGQGIAEARARGVHVVGAGRIDAEPAGHLGRGVRDLHLGGAGGDDHQVDVAGGQTAGRQRLAASRDRHVGDCLVRARDPAAGDPDAAADPLVAGIHGGGDLVIGDDPARLVAAERQDPSARRALGESHRSSPYSVPLGCSRTRGWPTVTGSPSSTSHSMIVAGKAEETGWLPPRISTCPSSAPVLTAAPGSAAVRCACPARNVPESGATSSRQSGAWLSGWRSSAPPSAIAAWAASSSRAAPRSPGPFRARVCTPGSARRARPVSVPAGGSSISAVTPRPAMVCMHRSHRTGVLTCVTIRSSQSGPLRTTLPSRLDSTVSTGLCTATVAAASRSASTAGPMWLVWNAPATDSGRSRACGGGSAANAASRSMVPAATIWPAPLTFAGVSPLASIAASTSGSSPPSTAVIPVASAAAARAMARPRTRTRRIASSGASNPEMAPAANSPTLCPAAAPTPAAAAASASRGGRPVPPASSAAAAIAAATSSGCATAVSRISSASAVVPYRIRSQPASSDQGPSRSAKWGSSSHSSRKPGVWAPWPGAAMRSIPLACTVELRHTNAEPHEVLALPSVGSLQTFSVLRPASVPSLRADQCSRALLREAPERHR